LALDDDLRRAPSLRVVAAGKAAAGMARAAQEVLRGRLRAGLITGAPGTEPASAWQAVDASHPIPTSFSEAAGRAALSLAADAARDREPLVVCLSGGASAMLAVPAPGLTIEDKAAATVALLRSGLDIAQMNLVRRHLSAIKGGQLAAAAGWTATLAISDVHVPAELEPSVIASGPTVGDDSARADALQVLERHRLVDAMPVRVIARLRSDVVEAGPVATRDRRLRRSAYWIVASRHEAMRAAATAARRLGYDVRTLESAVTGPAREAPGLLLSAGRGFGRPACLIASGETTVKVTGGGRGGRNQELTVAALEPLAALGPAALASIGTDGIDGPTDAAGAFVDSTMWGSLGAGASARRDAALAGNDAYPLLDGLGALVRTGPTGTNVGDLMVLLLPAQGGDA
jgi:glycerate-2-kinase